MSLNIFNILGRGWELFKAQCGTALLLSTLLVIACQGISSGVQNFAGLLFSFVAFYFFLGLTNMCLQISKGAKAEFSDLVIDGKVFLNYLIAVFAVFIVMILIFILGFLLVTGIVELVPNFQYFVYYFFGFLAVVFAYWVVVRYYLLLPFFVLDQSAGPLEALKGSFKATEGHGLKLFGFLIIASLLYIVGAILLLVGLLVAIPWVLISQALIYHDLRR